MIRPDGKHLHMGDNVWTTHRIVRPEGQAPYAEDFLHIVDLDSSGSYTLVYTDMFPWNAPVIGETTATTIVLANLGSTYGDTVDHAVQETLSGRYVGPSGKLQTNPFWQPRSAWSNLRVWGLTPSTSYAFAAKARPSGIETALSPSCPAVTSVGGDIDGDGSVDVVDLLYLAYSFGFRLGQSGYEVRADLNGDGSVDVPGPSDPVEYWPK